MSSRVEKILTPLPHSVYLDLMVSLWMTLEIVQTLVQMVKAKSKSIQAPRKIFVAVINKLKANKENLQVNISTDNLSRFRAHSTTECGSVRGFHFKSRQSRNNGNHLHAQNDATWCKS